MSDSCLTGRKEGKKEGQKEGGREGGRKGGKRQAVINVGQTTYWAFAKHQALCIKYLPASLQEPRGQEPSLRLPWVLELHTLQVLNKHVNNCLNDQVRPGS